MTSTLGRLRWTRELARRVKDPTTVKLLLAHRIIAARISGLPTAPMLAWPDEGVSTSLVDERFVLEGASHLLALRALGAKWSRHRDGRLLLEVGQVKLAPGSVEELLIANEIFSAGVYNFSFARPTVLLDIGANVGIASLALARDPCIERIYAYEPLHANLERARANLDLNPLIASRIELVPFALGSDRRAQEIEYSPEWRGSTSIHTAPREITRLHLEDSATPSTTLRARIEVVPATTAIEHVAQRHPEAELWAKIDCEGGEDEIMPALAATGSLCLLRGLVMETHCGNGPKQQQILADAGFTVWRPKPAGGDLGYLLAFRS